MLEKSRFEDYPHISGKAPEFRNARQVIGQDTPVVGGVLPTRYALVADYNENPIPYEDAYTFLTRELVQPDARSPLEIARAISRTVLRLMPFDSTEASKIIKAEATRRGKYLLDLTDEFGVSNFIGRGGNCQVQALFGATLLELLQDRGDIGGQVSVESLPAYASRPDRHVWIRYTKDDTRVVINSANSTVLELDDGTRPNSNPLAIQNSTMFWRPGERPA